jgi:RNase H-fold protein (predicted Holliday junction resolvase)
MNLTMKKELPNKVKNINSLFRSNTLKILVIAFKKLMREEETKTRKIFSVLFSIKINK